MRGKQLKYRWSSPPLCEGGGYVPVFQENTTCGSWRMCGRHWIIQFLDYPVHPPPSPESLLFERVDHLYPTCTSHVTLSHRTCTINSILRLCEDCVLSSTFQERWSVCPDRCLWTSEKVETPRKYSKSTHSNQVWSFTWGPYNQVVCPHPPRFPDPHSRLNTGTSVIVTVPEIFWLPPRDWCFSVTCVWHQRISCVPTLSPFPRSSLTQFHQWSQQYLVTVTYSTYLREIDTSKCVWQHR